MDKHVISYYNYMDGFAKCKCNSKYFKPLKSKYGRYIGTLVCEKCGIVYSRIDQNYFEEK